MLSNVFSLKRNGGVFICVWMLDKAEGKAKMYYCITDTSKALATVDLSVLFEYINTCPGKKQVI